MQKECRGNCNILGVRTLKKDSFFSHTRGKHDKAYLMQGPNIFISKSTQNSNCLWFEINWGNLILTKGKTHC